jgi:hypothetical protein
MDKGPPNSHEPRREGEKHPQRNNRGQAVGINRPQFLAGHLQQFLLAGNLRQIQKDKPIKLASPCFPGKGKRKRAKNAGTRDRKRESYILFLFFKYFFLVKKKNDLKSRSRIVRRVRGLWEAVTASGGFGEFLGASGASGGPPARA